MRSSAGRRIAFARQVGRNEDRVTVGAFSSARADGAFRLAYLMWNTIENLTTQAAQVACFRNVAEHLEPGGCFVIEVQVPDLRRLPHGERFVIFDAIEKHWALTSSMSPTRA